MESKSCARVLVVDDEENIRSLIRTRLEADGLMVLEAVHAEDALHKNPHWEQIAVLIADLRLPGVDGLELIEQAQRFSPSLKSIMISGVSEKAELIRALRLGVSDFFEKPLNLNELSAAVQRALHSIPSGAIQESLHARLRGRLTRAEGMIEDRIAFTGKSPAMKAVNEGLMALKRESMKNLGLEPNVMLLGEQGSGQDGVARFIHQSSKRRLGPWAVLNCFGKALEDIELELFGSEKRSNQGVQIHQGLFELLEGGTLVLKNVEILTPVLQLKICESLVQGSYRRLGSDRDLPLNVRMVSSTTVGVRTGQSPHKIEPRLYALLSKVELEVPPLRLRSEDILPMASHFAERAFRLRGKRFQGFSAEAGDQLRAYPWPGNVWELYYVVERTALVCEGEGLVEVRFLNLGSSEGASSLSGFSDGGAGEVPAIKSLSDQELLKGFALNKKSWVEHFEMVYLESVLKKSGGNVSEAARSAQLDRSNFLRLLRKYQMHSTAFRKKAA